MAKKQTETPSLLETFRDFNQTKNIDDTTLLGVLEESFRSVIAKIFGTDENFTVVVNPDKGDFEITRQPRNRGPTMRWKIPNKLGVSVLFFGPWWGRL